MTRVCTVCRHPNRPAIDEALVRGEPMRAVADRYALSEAAVRRHKAEHLPEALVKASERVEATSADDLLAQVQQIQTRTLIVLENAEKSGNGRLALQAVRECRNNVALLAKMVVLALESESTRMAREQAQLCATSVAELDAQIEAGIEELLVRSLKAGDRALTELAAELLRGHGYAVTREQA